MCGICGFSGNTVNKEQVLANMLTNIKHRGPDDVDSYYDEITALGFCRLSFIDIERGRQPIYNEDNNLVLLFNGEIYNYKVLREELIAKNHHFATNSDGEVILHGFEEYGQAILNQLRGMFSFVIYNKTSKKIFAARDPFGIKPFYYYLKEGLFLFASELKCFFSHPDFQTEVNTNSLSYHLSFGFTPSNETLFKNVLKLPPGAFLNYDAINGILDVNKYFQLDFAIKNKLAFSEHVVNISEVVSDSVKAHSMRDDNICIGSFMSSGVDSNFIVREAASIPNFKVFSVGYDSERYSEIPYVEKNAQEANVKLHARLVGDKEYLNSINKVVYHLEEPVADPSVPAIYALANEASKYVKVVFSGEGADELFGGYNSYKRIYFIEKYQKLPFFFRSMLANVVKKVPVKGRNFFLDSVKPLEERYVGCGGIIFTKSEQEALLKNTSLYKDPSNLIKEVLSNTDIKDDVSRAQYIDTSLWLPNDILLKADKMSMAHALEVRVPFLDKYVYMKSRTIPRKYRVNRKNTKIALRQAAAQKMSSNTSNKKKLGFPVPLREWLKSDEFFAKIEQTLTNSIAAEFFELSYLHKILHEQKNNSKDNSKKIWLIYSFLMWYAVFFDKELDETKCTKRALSGQ